MMANALSDGKSNSQPENERESVLTLYRRLEYVLAEHANTLKCKFLSERLHETHAGGQREPGGGIR